MKFTLAVLTFLFFLVLCAFISYAGGVEWGNPRFAASLGFGAVLGLWAAAGVYILND